MLARERVIASGAVTETQDLADTMTHQAIDHLTALTDHPWARQALTTYAQAILTPQVSGSAAARATKPERQAISAKLRST